MKLAEILKDVPSGTKMYSPFLGEVEFIEVALNGETPSCIHIRKEYKGEKNYWLNPDGTFLNGEECMLYPSKDCRDWSNFFKDGDIITCTNSSCSFVSIFKRVLSKTSFERYCLLILNDGTFRNSIELSDFIKPRFATEEEQQKLFDAIKRNGYKWNAETKTLEKQTKPIFNIGDKIEKLGYRFTIAQVKDDYYLTKCGNKIPFDNQDDFRLVPNKFDITTLKPFDKVLVRNTNTECWRISLFGCFSNEERYFMCLANCAFYQCIPYNDDTQHLLGRVIDAPKFYKTW